MKYIWSFIFSFILFVVTVLLILNIKFNNDTNENTSELKIIINNSEIIINGEKVTEETAFDKLKTLLPTQPRIVDEFFLVYDSIGITTIPNRNRVNKISIAFQKIDNEIKPLMIYSGTIVIDNKTISKSITLNELQMKFTLNKEWDDSYSFKRKWFTLKFYFNENNLSSILIARN